ncbi:hypothetical protein M378DRAFT_993340 [Amanita muscaria Koide BX008]|uniref:Uncharacterized protein n=1 Tax=Amanita muscaria (strain Koide BX008) TaxID=946122 RepID=A0A0C2SWX1_AMAMK|nr:hypothetical protein M378DRAFT_993340 [Amanita muscaria Koide BX008]
MGQCYPYADDQVRDFLTTPQNERQAHLHAITFLLAIFEHTEATLQSDSFHTKTEYSDVAASFRQYMITSKYPNQRQMFLDTVVTKARKYSNESQSRAAGSIIDFFILGDSGEKIIDRMHSARISLDSLLEAKHPSADHGPILLVAWDEAHSLISPHSSWSHLTALHRVLSVHPTLFSIFVLNAPFWHHWPGYEKHPHIYRSFLDIVIGGP